MGAWLIFSVQFSSVTQLCPTETPWTAAHQASLFITISQSLLKLMFIELVMPSKHLILYHPLLLLPSIFPNIRVFFNDLYLIVHIINKAKNKPQPATMSENRQRVTASWQPCFWASPAAVTKLKVTLSLGYLLGHVPSLHPSGPPLPWLFQQFQGPGPSMPRVSACLNWVYLGRLGTRPGLTQISPNLLTAPCILSFKPAWTNSCKPLLKATPAPQNSCHTSRQVHARKTVFDCLYSCLVLPNRI